MSKAKFYKLAESAGIEVTFQAGRMNPRTGEIMPFEMTLDAPEGKPLVIMGAVLIVQLEALKKSLRLIGAQHIRHCLKQLNMDLTRCKMKLMPMVAVGKNQCKLLAFAEKYQGWHTNKIGQPCVLYSHYRLRDILKS